MSFPEKISDELVKAVKNQNELLAWRVAKKVGSAYTGGTANTHGDHDGTADPYTLFAVTGDVAVKAVVGIVNTDIAGQGTLEVGVAGNTAALIAQVADTATLDDGDVLVDATAAVGVEAIANTGMFVINDGADIIETLGTANLTAGQIDWYCIWAPLEAGASVIGG